jgi:nucleoside-diphosphate-sugar epimerase
MDDEVLAFAHQRRCDVVYASTAAICGQGVSPPAGSAAEFVAGIYQREKSITEDKGIAQAAVQNRRFSALRINAPYGPRQTASTVLQIFIRNALAGRDLLYHGSGSREQDFTYARDIASAFLAAAEGPNGYYTISGGEPITMRDLAEMVCSIAGVPISFAKPSGKPDPQEGLTARLDTSSARKELNWLPKTDLRRGLAACIDTSIRT